MSSSKLESLPNEILIELFEKYINAIDIIKSFRFQLNKRFDLLISECRRFNFNFIKCRKTDFCFTMGLLPAYIDKIEQLALSEQNAPGQIHAFFASKSSSSFELFKGLRKLYINIVADTVEPMNLTRAFQSLTKTNLHTLSIVISEAETTTSFSSIITQLFGIETLKKLSIINNSKVERIYWESLQDSSSNIEYLTLKRISCDFGNLLYIFQCASSLKYVDLSLQSNRYYRSKNVASSKKQKSIQMSKLHTMILKIEGDTTSLEDSINSVFQYVPLLIHLEVRIDNSSFDVTIWENFVKNNLPNLTYFTLQYSSFRLDDDDANNILKTIQIPFWIERKNFNIILKNYINDIGDQYYLNSQENSTVDDLRLFTNKWYILPQRQQENIQFHLTNQITNVNISSKSKSLTQNYYLNNVQNLIIDEINDNLLDLLQTHINFPSIKHLDISNVRNINNYLLLILIPMINLRSLRIKTEQLNLLKTISLTNHQKLIFIDLFSQRHSFNKEYASILSKVFPYVEHLRISPINLSDVPMLNTSFPKLRSLTFPSNKMDLTDDYETKMYDVNLREITNFLFYRRTQWLTVWLDQDAFQENYWKIGDTVRVDFDFNRRPLLVGGYNNRYDSRFSDFD